MATVNEHIREYTRQLKKGEIQLAYRTIMSFMSELKSDFENRYPDMISSTLYYGYMDMTYFALTPQKLKDRKLKIAIVYLHEEARFEFWLAGTNRKIQAETIDRLKHVDCGQLILSKVEAGVDSIVYKTLEGDLDFNKQENLKNRLAREFTTFIHDIDAILS